MGVLSEMERDGTLDPGWRSRLIEVLNKADLLGGIAQVKGRPGAVAVSAMTGEGLAALTEAIDGRIGAGMETADYDIEPSDGARLAWLYQHGEVTERRDDEDLVHVTVRLLPADRARFERRA
jgi:GTP-binding protein HflX